MQFRDTDMIIMKNGVYILLLGLIGLCIALYLKVTVSVVLATIAIISGSVVMIYQRRYLRKN